MREIKFKAWDKDRKVFETILDIHFNGGEANGITFNLGGWGNNGRKDLIAADGTASIVLCQFTGLNDEYNTDIYENDIIQYSVTNVQGDKHYIAVEVTKSDYGWHPFDDPLYCMDKAYELKVIGNTFENPEILNENKSE